MRRRLRRALALAGCAVALATVLVAVPTGDTMEAVAATGSDFSPGKIITDENFHDSTRMSASQIQAFLELRVPRCNGGTCLKDYRQTTWTRAADAQCAQYDGRSNERASDIIARVAVACGINPQVLLVLLQKEQSLVTSTAPSAAMYQMATGYACPDTAPCDAEFAGFFNQVYKAAWQYRVYENRPSSFNWFPVGRVTNILKNPNAGCGTIPVFIENQATANLYYYTPYAPNEAALANLYGTGDGCSSYGNRNFWRIYSDWFGSPSGPKTAFGSFDTAYAVIGGVQITGWSLDPFSTASSYIWVNVDGTGGPFRADLPLGWIGSAYPGLGPNHGFDVFIPTSPGSHQICVYGTNSVQLGCKAVNVAPAGNADGAIQSVTSEIGEITVSGWSVDLRTAESGYVWVNVDGVGGAARANLSNAAAGAAHPELGDKHGFTATFPAVTGRHEVCVYGTDSVQLGCRIVWTPESARGSFDTVVGGNKSIRVTGWSLDLTTTESTYIWINVDGAGSPARADVPLNWMNAYYPGIGANHGFDVTLPATIGTHQVCVYGTHSVELDCKSVTVESTGRGSFDTATAGTKSIRVTGWSLDLTTTESTYIWINVDGAGGPARADVPLNWMNAYYPGIGANHGFDVTLPATMGTHQVCVYGTDSTSLGCKSVEVKERGAGSFDTATAVAGGIRITGWAVDRLSTSTVYVWANVDGSGGPLAANLPLNWIDGYIPGVGPNHGFDTVLPAAPGKHQVCLYGLDSMPLGCKTVVAP